MIPRGALERNPPRLRGELLFPGRPGYDDARRVYNAMVDRRPGAIARCASAADVQVCVEWARNEGVEVSVRGGGHNVSGKAVCAGGLMIDLSRMKQCRVDPAARTARAEPGLTLGELDRATQEFGLATPTGIVSATGLAGLTLGGGIGWLNGKHGLACDNLFAVEIVTADGALRAASSAENADLFWAVRGGGANLGVVTAFEFRLHEIGPVLGGGVAWPLSRASEVLPFYADLLRDGPDELSANAGLFEVEGTHVIGVSVAWSGELERGERFLQRLRSFGQPVADGIARMGYVDLQGGGDAAFPQGRRHYWKGNFLRRLEQGAIERLIEFTASRPSPYTMIGLQHMHGAAARVPAGDTAFPHRATQWDCILLSQWDDPRDDEANVAWTRRLHGALQPWLENAVYVNDLGEDDTERVPAAYGANYERLVAVKRAYDPANFFRGNSNVAVAAS